MNKRIMLTETVLRDGQQSLIATRMHIEDMIPILSEMDKVGYDAIECWGGATFDSCIRFLDEDPWERLRTFRKAMPNSKLQMLLRGQNLLGYRHYSDDVVDKFVKSSIDNGIDIIRIFDALNDIRNVKTAVDSAKKYGAQVQVAMAYTTGEPYTVDYWLGLAEEIEKTGSDSICIKDMAGLMRPKDAKELITSLKEHISIPVHLHSHCTGGLAPITYFEAIIAGCDGIDTAISPFSSGTSQPATEVMLEALKGTGCYIDLDPRDLKRIANHFNAVRERAVSTGAMNTKVLDTDTRALIYQVPGGMISNLLSQLKEQHAEDRYFEVMEEVPLVRKDLGVPPLVTPSSQIVGTQAILNVILGERYKVISKETQDFLKGKYGKTPSPMSSELLSKIDQSEIISCRPADMIEQKVEDIRAEIEDMIEQDEDVLTYAIFGKTAIEFLKRRKSIKNKVDPDAFDKENKSYPV